MKKILFVLLLLPMFAYGQQRVEPVRPFIEVVQLNDSVASGATYAASQSDTTVAYQFQNFTDAYLVVTSTDSVSAKFSYFGSADGATFEDFPIYIDSASSAGQGAPAANGIIKSIQVPKAVMGLAAAKFQITFQNTGINGVTSPKYTLRLVRR